MQTDLKTKAYVTRRTNYGEADRIINLITPNGNISAIAKGARKPKSKLAGGIELFALTEINLHFGKSDMAIVTGAKMIKFDAEILKDYARMELAVEILKKVDLASRDIESPDFFEIVDKCLSALNDGTKIDLVETWYLMNLAKIMGEQVNLYYDTTGTKLDVKKNYDWNYQEMGLQENDYGPIDANMIKAARLFVSADIAVIKRIKNIEDYLPEILKIARAINKITK